MKDNDQEREWDNHRAGDHPAYVEKIMASWQRISRFRACPADGSDCYQCGEVCMKRRESEYPFYNPPFNGAQVPVQPSVGWICPVCERGVSPLFAVCPCASLPADPSTNFRIV